VNLSLPRLVGFLTRIRLLSPERCRHPRELQRRPQSPGNRRHARIPDWRSRRLSSRARRCPQAAVCHLSGILRPWRSG